MADNDLADDLLKGADKIAKHIGEKPRATYHLLETQKIPAFKMGKIWYARKSTLRRHIESLESQAN